MWGGGGGHTFGTECVLVCVCVCAWVCVCVPADHVHVVLFFTFNLTGRDGIICSEARTLSPWRSALRQQIQETHY